jgi:phenylpropionate dioxygenase-like ring-hydroxylating dioxygenase large terminal subunit
MAGRTLPWSWYSDPDVLRREQERIFRRAWQYVGHTGLVKRVGDRFAAWAGEIPVLVLRADDGVRAFLNVCRHRGSLLVDSEGNGKSVQCPYHAWTYDLDGSLRAAPRSDREPDFDGNGLSLVPLRLETWGPFLFVNPDDDAPPLAETLGPLADLVPFDGLAFHSRDEYGLDANWKIACENYLECYHCPVAHKGFSAAYDVDPDQYRLRPISDHVLSQFAPARSPRLRSRCRSKGSRALPATPASTEGQFHFVWPNLKLNAYAGTPNLSIGPILPAGPERSRGFLDYFFAPGAEPAWVDELLEFDRQVGAEDRALVERVQKGVRSGIVAEGRLLGESEQLVARFQELVAEAIG